MQYRESPPPPDLRLDIEALWTVSGAIGQRIRVLPDGCTDLIVGANISDGMRFVGPMTRARVVTVQWEHTHGLRFRPGTLALFEPGMSLRRYQDRDRSVGSQRSGWEGAEALIGLVRSMLEAGSIHRHAVVDDLLQAMGDAEASATLSELYHRRGLAERTVQRLFDRYVGLTPKQTAQILRQRHVTRVLRADGDSGDLADLASTYGYSDQSHLSRDYAAQVGLPPGRYRREIRDVGFVQDSDSP